MYFIATVPNLGSLRRRGILLPLAHSFLLRTLRDPSLALLVLTEDGGDHILDDLLVLKGLGPLVELLVLLSVGELLIHAPIIAPPPETARVFPKKLIVLSAWYTRT